MVVECLNTKRTRLYEFYLHSYHSNHIFVHHHLFYSEPVYWSFQKLQNLAATGPQEVVYEIVR